MRYVYAFVLKTLNRKLLLPAEHGPHARGPTGPLSWDLSAMAAIGVHFGYTCACVAIFKVRCVQFLCTCLSHTVPFPLLDKIVTGLSSSQKPHWDVAGCSAASKLYVQKLTFLNHFMWDKLTLAPQRSVNHPFHQLSHSTRKAKKSGSELSFSVSVGVKK